MTDRQADVPQDEDDAPARADFAHLSPDVVLEAVESALGTRCSGICRPLNSYINRVYEVGLSDGAMVVAKFYRPRRWSRDALQDELDFLSELEAAEVPVIPPLSGPDGARLHALEGAFYAVFPKKGGRPCDEPDDEGWLQLGRLLARMHMVGAAHAPRDRVRMDPRHMTADQVAFLLDSGLIPASQRASYAAVAHGLLDRIAPLFDDAEVLRIHGDCHRQNILHRPGEPFYLIDFDDMAVGPPVQDLWMLLPGHRNECRVELELLLEGYTLFRDFDRATLRLIEPLRAMRFIHYTAWCAKQKADGGFSRLSPEWGTEGFWRQEIADLERQQKEIADSMEAED